MCLSASPAENSINFSRKLELKTVTDGSVMSKPAQPRIIAGMPAYNEEKYIGTMQLGSCTLEWFEIKKMRKAA